MDFDGLLWEDGIFVVGGAGHGWFEGLGKSLAIRGETMTERRVGGRESEVEVGAAMVEESEEGDDEGCEELGKSEVVNDDDIDICVD